MSATDPTVTRPAAEDVTSQRGESIAELSRDAPLLVVLLRHSGCAFCKQALADLRDSRAAIEASGTRIAIVHMDEEDSAAARFRRYGLEDLPRFSDPDRRLYAALGVERGSMSQVMGPRMWGSAIGAMARGHLPGRPKGDLLQMPGAVLVRGGEVVRRYSFATSGDRPDYAAFACEGGCE